MAALKGNAYEWYSYKGKESYLFESLRGQEGSLIKGKFFGVRRAGSKKGVFRVILKELGPSTVFSLSEKETQELLKKSTPVSGGTQPLDAKTKALISRLGKIDPKDFWAVVKALNWPKMGKDPKYAETAKSSLRECYKLQDVRRLTKTVASKRVELQKVVERLEKRAGRQLYMGGDDSFHDSLPHAVSMGQKSFESFLKKPELFVKKFNRPGSEYSNFEYCFD